MEGQVTSSVMNIRSRYVYCEISKRTLQKHRMEKELHLALEGVGVGDAGAKPLSHPEINSQD